MASELKSPELSRSAAYDFVERWKNTTNELQYAQSFWSDFFRTLCGIEDEKLAGIEYQKRVKGDACDFIQLLGDTGFSFTIGVLRSGDRSRQLGDVLKF